MKILWNVINEMKLNKAIKNNLFLGAHIFVCLAAGGSVWLVLGRLLLPGTDWLLCFMGCPAVYAGFFGGIIYLYNHKFS